MLRPFICYLSQFEFATMSRFITEEEQADCYFEKPLPSKDLISLLRLLNVL